MEENNFSDPFKWEYIGTVRSDQSQWKSRLYLTIAVLAVIAFGLFINHVTGWASNLV